MCEYDIKTGRKVGENSASLEFVFSLCVEGDSLSKTSTVLTTAYLFFFSSSGETVQINSFTFLQRRPLVLRGLGPSQLPEG